MDYEILTVEAQRNGYMSRLEVLEQDIFQKTLELEEFKAIYRLATDSTDIRHAKKEIDNLEKSIDYTLIRINVIKEALKALPEPSKNEAEQEQ